MRTKLTYALLVGTAASALALAANSVIAEDPPAESQVAPPTDHATGEPGGPTSAPPVPPAAAAAAARAAKGGGGPAKRPDFPKFADVAKDYTKVTLVCPLAPPVPIAPLRA